MRRRAGSSFIAYRISRGVLLVSLALLIHSTIGSLQVFATTGEQRPFIREFRVQGATLLTLEEIETVLYPYLGPGRTPGDIDRARKSLEGLYRDKGYETAYVSIPIQRGRGGVIILQANETEVGRLRVRGGRYTDPDVVATQVQSMAEGTVPNFNDVMRDVIALNQFPGRQVTPQLREGVKPGTVDIDLEVEDEFPLKGSVELNNRYSAGTTELRLNASVNYWNLWQAGHVVGATAQVTPLDLDEVTVLSGFYQARFPGLDGFTMMAQGSWNDSRVTTLGDVAVVGRGHSFGLRGIFTLPSTPTFFQSVSAGVDRRRFEQQLNIGGETLTTPLTYYPFSLLYSGVWRIDSSMTELYAGPVFHLRGWGSSTQEWDANRFGATGSFLSLRGELARTREFQNDFTLYGRVHGQLADSPLVSSEQFAGGGQGTVRGYLEAEIMGDQALLGTLELRSPPLPVLHPSISWRAHAFTDGGFLSLRQALPEQEDRFSLASVGVGSTFRYRKFLSGGVEIAVPLIEENQTERYRPRILFRALGEF